MNKSTEQLIRELAEKFQTTEAELMDVLRSALYKNNNNAPGVREFLEDVRFAAKAFEMDCMPDAWLFLGEYESNDAGKTWCNSPDPLLGLPVYHCPAELRHLYDGERSPILPLWKGDVSDKTAIIEQFERLLEGKRASRSSFRLPDEAFAGKRKDQS